MYTHSKSTLFLMEQIIVIAVFALCAAVCVNIFVESYLMTVGSRQKNDAIIIAENYAECYKAVSGDLNAAASIIGASLSNGALKTYYNDEWNVCAEDDAAFLVTLRQYRDGALHKGDISVNKTDGEVIVNFSVAVRGD